MSVRGTCRPLFLPLPLEGIDFKPPDLRGLPGELLATIRQLNKVFRPQDPAVVPAALKQDGPLTGSLLGKDDTQFEAAGVVPDFNLTDLLGLGKTMGHCPLDVEIGYITVVFGLSQGDQDIPAVALLIAINDRARRTLIIRKNFTIPPGIILKGVDVILEELDSLLFSENGFLALGVQQFQGGVILNDFIHSLTAISPPQLAEQAIQIREQDEPILREEGQGFGPE